MRKLLLIRHAKSSWKFPDLDDHERPLNRRGERDSLIMARHLQDKDEALDVIYSSTATRALMLAESICDLNSTTLIPELSFNTFEADELLEILRCLPNDVHRVGIVAHNELIKFVAAGFAVIFINGHGIPPYFAELVSSRIKKISSVQALRKW